MSNDRAAQIEAGHAIVKEYIALFQTSHKALKDAAKTFRESTSLEYRECNSVVKALQAMRKQTCACLEHLKSVDYIFAYDPLFRSETQLYRLDGEITARLILEMDLFASLTLHSSMNENIKKAHERIEMHVSLQRDLKDELKEVSDLLNCLRKLATEEPRQ